MPVLGLRLVCWCHPVEMQVGCQSQAGWWRRGTTWAGDWIPLQRWHGTLDSWHAAVAVLVEEDAAHAVTACVCCVGGCAVCAAYACRLPQRLHMHAALLMGGWVLSHWFMA